MTSYRPICDFWFLARAKLKDKRKYYGSYLGGFPERARRLIGCPTTAPMLHVCGGMAKYYPYEGGFCEHDKTMDLDPACEPDFLQDARDPFPAGKGLLDTRWGGILMDPPYSEQDADHYSPGSICYPKPNLLINNAIEAVRVGMKVGLIHYVIPMCPKNAKFIACVGIGCGFNNRIRVFSVFERIS